MCDVEPYPMGECQGWKEHSLLSDQPLQLTDGSAFKAVYKYGICKIVEECLVEH